MAKFEHIFEVAASVDKDGHVVVRMKKDDGIVLTKARTGVGYGNYEFELGTAEFEDEEKVLRKQRREIKDLLKRRFEDIKRMRLHT